MSSAVCCWLLKPSGRLLKPGGRSLAEAQQPVSQARRYCNGWLIKPGGSAGAVSEKSDIFLHPH